MAEAKTVIAISEETHRLMKILAADTGTTIYALAERFLRAGLGARKHVEPEESGGFGYRGNAFTGIDVVDPDEVCLHERLTEDGICRTCGKDCRGAA
jgi:hypothetical protein